jgi:hypothetical protein
MKRVFQHFFALTSVFACKKTGQGDVDGRCKLMYNKKELDREVRHGQS